MPLLLEELNNKYAWTHAIPIHTVESCGRWADLTVLGQKELSLEKFVT